MVGDVMKGSTDGLRMRMSLLLVLVGLQLLLALLEAIMVSIECSMKLENVTSA